MTAPNNRRFDLSNRLIHFFRPLTLDHDDAPLTPDEWGPGDIVEDTRISPFFLLRNAVRLGRLWASWAVRGGRRTVYGPRPAVCFTDMPLGAFIQAAEERSERGEAISPYALVFPKQPLHSLGARPVIYGLSTSPTIPAGNRHENRIIPEAALPLAEQYRYVTFAPDARIDWTHEREWRWPCDEELEIDEDMPEGLPPNNGRSIPGLSINDRRLNGLGAVVKTERQANQFIHDVLTTIDCGRSQDSQYDFVVVRGRIPDLAALRDPNEAERVISGAAFTLDPYFSQTHQERHALLNDFDAAVQQVLALRPSQPAKRASASTWLWLINNRHRMTRALVATGRVHVNANGRYLVRIPEFAARSADEREAMVKELASLMVSRFKCRATYHTVAGSCDPDGVPHYSDPPTENRFHFNYAHDSGDF